jgi:hypothetical protein
MQPPSSPTDGPPGPSARPDARAFAEDTSDGSARAEPARLEDPELRDLPRPPSRTRILTLSVLTITAIASTWMALSLLPEARFALSLGPPQDVGELGTFLPKAEQTNTWIRGAADISPRAARYTRPLDGDSYRLAQVRENPLLWVQMRIPAGLSEEHFLPPASFVGRLLPMETAGLRYSNLQDAVRQAGGDPRGAWLLVDGEAPLTTRWALGLVAMFTSFALFCSYGLFRLTRSVGRAL